MRFQRVYPHPTQSILLLGPRGIGKSTFIRQDLRPDFVVDLLKQETKRVLSLNPSRLEEMTSHLNEGSTILIDEVQHIPELLDEVHRLIEGRRFVFWLTGSSARSIRRRGVNLLAGRALSKKMYPLCLKEIGSERSISQLLFSGLLPTAVTGASDEAINDYLFSYVETYLKEEIIQEGLVRSLNDFSKFLEVAGQFHGQILNFESLAREVGRSGETIKSWFQILQDTLIGELIESYPLGVFARETRHSKFYFFDCGVARAAQGFQSLDEIPEQRGFYLETIILNELKTFFEVSRKRFKIFYFSVPGGGDIDFIIETRKKTISAPAQFVCLEIKNSKVWKASYEDLVLRVKAAKSKQVTRVLGVYRGEHRLTRGPVEVYPINEFIKSLWANEIL